MNKIAKAVRAAEINGFVAGLIDTGVIKVASEEEASIIAEVIEEHLPEEYDMEDAMAVAADVVDALDENAGGVPEEEDYPEEDYPEEDPGMAVQASDEGEVDERALMAAYGELAMAKQAGDISEEEFQKEAKSLAGIATAAKDMASKAWNSELATGRATKAWNSAKGAPGKAMGQLKAGFKGSDISDRMGTLKKNKAAFSRKTPQGKKTISDTKKSIARAMARTGVTYGTAGAAAAGAGVGGKALYDKYKN